MPSETNRNNLKTFLDEKVRAYNRPAFIADNPVCNPYLFTKNQDIEIVGLFAAVFAWGNRTTIIQKSRELMERMDMQPYAFITQHSISNLKRLEGFKHRTFMADDVFPSKQCLPDPSFALTAGREGRRCAHGPWSTQRPIPNVREPLPERNQASFHRAETALLQLPPSLLQVVVGRPDFEFLSGQR